MKKRYRGLVLAAFLLFGSTLTVSAEDFVGNDNWKAEFTGDKLESSFTSEGFADEIKDLQPGDSILIKIAVKNSSGRETNWYVSNEVLRSLEDGSPANGGAYTYRLAWERGGEEDVLFNSETVGGENEQSERQGLHGATSGLEDSFYLDTLGSGEEGEISLRVALDGETQGNDYQNTLARLRLNLAVEETDGNNGNNGDGNNGGGNDGGGNNGGNNNGGGNNGGGSGSSGGGRIYTPGGAQTGDPAQLMLLSVAALVSGLALMILVVVYQRKDRGGNKHE